MLIIKLRTRSLYNERSSTFVDVGAKTLRLQHSLVSISKWEALFKKPFIGHEEHHGDAQRYYFQCMVMNQHLTDEELDVLVAEHSTDINEYVNDSQTATIVHTYRQESGGLQIMTSERIYAWMVKYSIPFECQKWHLNRLLTLIRVCHADNSTSRMGKKDLYNQNAMLNAERRSKLNSRG